jgi:hypothetical protein
VSYLPIGPPMPGPWGPLSMMYPPCPPWVGWCGPCTAPPMHFHPGGSGPTQGFGHGCYYTGDSRYRHIGHQHGRKASGQENWIVRNVKPDHPISQEAVVAPSHQQEQETPNGSSVDQQGSIQGKEGPRSETSVDDEAKPDAEKNLEEALAEHGKVPGAKTKTKTEVRTSS